MRLIICDASDERIDEWLFAHHVNGCSFVEEMQVRCVGVSSRELLIGTAN